MSTENTTNIIKVRFFKGAIAIGRDYTYYTPVEVTVGDVVNIETNHGIARAMVSQINIPEAEIAPFKDRAKSIIGKTDLRCEYCTELNCIGEGDHICDYDPHKMPLSGYAPTDDYFWCNGAYFNDTRQQGS